MTQKSGLNHTISGVLSADWLQFARQSRAGAAAMQEVATGSPNHVADHDLDATVQDIIKTCEQHRRGQTHDARRRNWVTAQTFLQPTRAVKDSSNQELEF